MEARHTSVPEHRVAIAVFDGVELLDVAGPAQVFSTASRLSSRAGYRIELVAAQRGFVRTPTGIPLVADRSWHDTGPGHGTLIVPGGSAPDAAGNGVSPVLDLDLLAWLRGQPAGFSRIASVCTGAHVLAAAGLLDGHRATTHWATTALLKARHPDVHVESPAIFVQDGDIWTSAGVSAGIDLALALVAADHGDDLARRVAQWLVVYLRRPGGQDQFSSYLAPRRTVSGRLAELLAWLPAHLREDLSAEALARRVNVSPRHLVRVFRDQAGTTPAAFVERLRVQAAADHLVHTDAPLQAVAAAAGFGSVASLHRAFTRHRDLTPGEYRSRFTTGASAPR